MTYIQTPTPKVEKSREFYQKLGYAVVGEEPLVLSDGKVFVEINPERTSRIELKLYAKSWDAAVQKCGKSFHIAETDDTYSLCDPNGVRVRLIKGEFPFTVAENSNGITGAFAGVSIEAFDVDRTLEFWDSLGFEKTMGDIATQGWGAMALGETGISIMKTGMCPHLFTNPGLTFFNSGKNLENIAKLENADIPITEEITVFNDKGIVDNVIIHDPGGLGFFVFND